MKEKQGLEDFLPVLDVDLVPAHTPGIGKILYQVGIIRDILFSPAVIKYCPADIIQQEMDIADIVKKFAVFNASFFSKTIKTPIHDAIPLLYADWTASGRMYLPIEERIREKLLPFVANTHTTQAFISHTNSFNVKI